MATEYVTCESTAAEVAEDTPVRYGGLATRPSALCGVLVAWDTRIPVTGARCMTCLKIWRQAVAPGR